jgi:hypothetical protein
MAASYWFSCKHDRKSTHCAKTTGSLHKPEPTAGQIHHGQLLLLIEQRESVQV